MKTKSKVALSVLAAVVVIGGGAGVFYAHSENVKAARQTLAKSQVKFNTEQGDFLEAKNKLDNDESATQSNFGAQYSQTHFTKKETVVLPQNSHYKVNGTAVTKWFVTYANELRKLNGNTTPLVWKADSGAQQVANELENSDSVTLTGSQNYDILSFSGIGQSADTSNRAQSDQQMGYELVMAIYDSTPNDTDSVEDVNYSGRAFLLYDAPNVGLSFASDDTVVFDQKLSSAYNAMIKTTTTPNTVALPDITFDYVNQTLLTQDKAKIAAEQAKVAAAKKSEQTAVRQLTNAKKSIF